MPASDRRETTERDLAAVMSSVEANLSRCLIRSQLGRPEDERRVRTSTQEPLSFFPFSANFSSPFRRLAATGGRPLLLRIGNRLVGDADLRRIDGGAAEFAILIGDRSRQGRGLGTRFGLMAHAFGFAVLDLRRSYASIVPDNVASKNFLAKLGYRIDNSAAARAYVDEASDLALSLTRTRFERLHGVSPGGMRIKARPRRQNRQDRQVPPGMR